jgi:tRNA dimethylallyltransferase
MAVARARPGTEIVSADSMQVYRGMDIGTAKPTPAERAEVRHHLVDLVEPAQEFTVALFRRAFDAAMADLAARGARPIVVGGTGLHLRVALDGIELPGRYPEVRAALDADPDTVGLHRRLAALDPVAAGRMEPTNRRRVLRALEVTLGAGRPFSSFGPGLDRYGPTADLLLGLRMPRDVLDRRIEQRYRQQLAEGFLAEVEALASGPLSPTAAQALGYRELLLHLRGACSLEEAVELAVRRTRRFARRQERWFRRDPRIRWIDVGENPLEVVPEVLGDFDRCG